MVLELASTISQPRHNGLNLIVGRRPGWKAVSIGTSSNDFLSLTVIRLTSECCGDSGGARSLHLLPQRPLLLPRSRYRVDRFPRLDQLILRLARFNRRLL